MTREVGTRQEAVLHNSRSRLPGTHHDDPQPKTRRPSLRPPSMRRVRLRSTSINIYLYEYSCSVFQSIAVTLPAEHISHASTDSRICHLIRSAPSADVAVSEYPIAIQLYRVYTYITTAYYKYIPTPRSDIAQCRHNIAQEADATGTVFVFDSVHPIRHRCRP